MTEKNSKRTYEVKSNRRPGVRLETNRTPALDQVTPEVYARLNRKQQAELVTKLIDFLKTF